MNTIENITSVDISKTIIELVQLNKSVDHTFNCEFEGTQTIAVIDLCTNVPSISSDSPKLQLYKRVYENDGLISLSLKHYKEREVGNTYATYHTGTESVGKYKSEQDLLLNINTITEDLQNHLVKWQKFINSLEK